MVQLYVWMSGEMRERILLMGRMIIWLIPPKIVHLRFLFTNCSLRFFQSVAFVAVPGLLREETVDVVDPAFFWSASWPGCMRDPCRCDGCPSACM